MWWKILLIIFALIFLLLFSSIHIIISYDGKFKLIAGFGLIRINVLNLVNKFMNKPKKEKPKKEEPEKQEKKEKTKEEPKDEKEAKPNVFKEVIELRGFDGAIDLLSEFASMLGKFGHGLFKHFVIRKITLEYSVCGKDAADTALKFGAVNASVYPLLGKIGSHSPIKKHHINIYADYLGHMEKQTVYIHMSYRLISLLAVALGTLRDFLKIMKREKSINARIKARSAAKAKRAQTQPAQVGVQS